MAKVKSRWIDSWEEAINKYDTEIHRFRQE